MKKRGNYLVGRCPFHDDKGRPNFVVYPGTQRFTCFACGATGDVIDFVARIDNITPREALRVLDGEQAFNGKSVVLPPRPAVGNLPEEGGELGDVATRDVAYSALLDLLVLSSPHKAALETRGLHLSAIRSNGYRTLPASGRAGIVRTLIEKGIELSGVPGFGVSLRTGRWWLYGSSGLLIPVRGVRGRIVGAQVRLDQSDGDGSKYLWLSSPDNERRYGGASSGAPCHVAGREYIRPGGDIYLTEGPLKADVASHFLRAPVLGVPGVSAWRKALPLVQVLAPRTVYLAFDHDVQESTRDAVAQNVKRLEDALTRQGWKVQEAEWRQGKGIDDALAAGEKIKAG